jgi:6-phosphofructokinase 1
MNAAIRAATSVLAARGCQIMGVRYGYRGLIERDWYELTARAVNPLVREGGTVLGSARCPDFRDRAGRDAAPALADEHVSGLLVIGGNGTLAGLRALTDRQEAGDFSLATIALPASIDNDIGLTGMAIGVDTAMNTIVEACDKIADTASAFNRTFLVEVMGRDSGYLAMTSAIAAGADAVLFPESGRSEDDIIESVVAAVLKARRREGHACRALVIKAEGSSIPLERLKQRLDERLVVSLGPHEPPVETRLTVLGHVVRGGRPSAFDRSGQPHAYVAAHAPLDGERDKMSRGCPPWSCRQRCPSHRQRSYCWLVELDAVLAETQRMLQGNSPLIQWRTRVFSEVEDILPG